MRLFSPSYVYSGYPEEKQEQQELYASPPAPTYHTKKQFKFFASIGFQTPHKIFSCKNTGFSQKKS